MIRAIVLRRQCSWVRRRHLGACRHVGMAASASPARARSERAARELRSG